MLKWMETKRVLVSNCMIWYLFGFQKNINFICFFKLGKNVRMIMLEEILWKRMHSSHWKCWTGRYTWNFNSSTVLLFSFFFCCIFLRSFFSYYMSLHCLCSLLLNRWSQLWIPTLQSLHHPLRWRYLLNDFNFYHVICHCNITKIDIVQSIVVKIDSV